MSLSGCARARYASRTAETLGRPGSVLVFRAPDGRMAAAADGLVGYGPDRDAALHALAFQIELIRADADPRWL